MCPNKKLLNIINSLLGYDLKERVTPVVYLHQLPTRGINLFHTRDRFYESVEQFGPYYIFNTKTS